MFAPQNCGFVLPHFGGLALVRRYPALQRPERQWSLICNSLWWCEMTNGEQKMLARGVAAGTIMGVAIGLIIALFIEMKPELFAGLIQ